MRIFGHRNAVEAVRDITEGCGELGIKYLTLYAFSTENWNRPKAEIDGLMELLVNTLKQEIKTADRKSRQTQDHWRNIQSSQGMSAKPGVGN